MRPMRICKESPQERRAKLSKLDGLWWMERVDIYRQFSKATGSTGQALLHARRSAVKFYQVSCQNEDRNHGGYLYFTDKCEAIAESRKQGRGGEFHPIEVKPTKAGILRALNQYAGHPDNG
jgi:hypothetical protein